MRYKQFLLQEGKAYSFEEIITMIMDKCQPVVKELLPFHYSDDFLYSGRKYKSEIFIGKIRKNRRPMDTPLEIHEMFDKMFKKKYGWEPRSNSIFCTGDIEQAGNYGKPYIIFPIGNFKYLWNPNIKDLFSNVFEEPDEWEIKPDDPNSILDLYYDKIDQEVRNIGENLYYKQYEGDPDTDPDIDDWIDDRYDEIIDDLLDKMVRENKRHNMEVYKEIVSEYSDRNLKKAIIEEKEIMVNCKEYIALDHYLYYDLLKYYLKQYGDKKPTRKILEEVDETVYYDKQVKFWKDN